jgi:hypothetical protein
MTAQQTIKILYCLNSKNIFETKHVLEITMMAVAMASGTILEMTRTPTFIMKVHNYLPEQLN